MSKQIRFIPMPAVLVLLLVWAGGCGLGGRDQSEGQLSGMISVDGSSTVYPITEAVAEEFRNEAPEVRVTVGISGTGGGFKKFMRGEIDIANASRPIKASELKLAEESNVQFIELPVAYDGIAVVVHPDNEWIDQLTVEELKQIWEPQAQGEVTRWNQIRPEWPDREMKLFGPGVDSGTYDYFTQAIVGEEGASRGDFTSSEDDNVLVQGIAGDPNALGFFGYAYYEENRGRVKAIPIMPEAGEEPVTPSFESVADGSYQPLSRPVFIYVVREAAEKPEIQEFVEFYLTDGSELVREVGYIPLPEDTYGLVLERFRNRKTGTLFGAEGAQIGVTVKDLLKGETSMAPAGQEEMAR